MAMRSVFNSFWNAAGDPLEAYQQLRWTRNSQGVQLTNPTPYYINLIQVSVNGKALSNVGVVPPKAASDKLVSGNSTGVTLPGGDK